MASALPPKGASNALYIIDLSSYVFRAYHGIRPLSSPTGEPTNATYGTVTMLQKLLTRQAPRLVAVAMDSKTKTFRHDISPDYKANRPTPPEDLIVQLKRSREVVQAFGMCVWQQDGVEADDLIAAGTGLAERAGMDVVIVSADKDLTQLVTDHVLMWDTMRDNVYGRDEVLAKFGVLPEQIGDYLSLVGDSSDNIRGVPSVGAKTASKLLTQYGDLDSILKAAPDMKAGRLRERLIEHADDAKLARRLVTLKSDLDVPISEDVLAYQKHTDTTKLIALFQELGFKRLVASMLDGDHPAPSVSREVPQHTTHYETVLTDAHLRRVVELCRRAGVFALDTETTSTDSMLAALVGVSLSWAPGRAAYIPCGHRSLVPVQQVPLATIIEVLGPVLADPEISKVGHHLKYDAKILRRSGFPWPKGIRDDTMLASYLLDPQGPHGLKSLAEKHLGVVMQTFDEVTDQANHKGRTIDQVSVQLTGPYACADADLSLQLRDMFAPLLKEHQLDTLYQTIEVPLLSVLAEMESTGVLIDRERLLALQQAFSVRIGSLEQQAQQQAGEPFNPNSPRQLEHILFDKLGLRVVKRTKTGRSTDARVLETLEDEHPLLKTILELRQLTKLKGTYVDTLPKLIHPETGRIHTKFNQTVTTTGRLSSSDPNLQNIPIRSEEGRSIRQAFIAERGFKIISADYSQIELRVLAHLAQDPVLMGAFREGQDVHTRTAMEIFDVDATNVTKQMRRQAKTIQFGIIYGMGEVSLSKRLQIERAEAKRFISRYFERYAGVQAYMEMTRRTAREQGHVKTMLGRIRPLPDINSSSGRLRAQAERIACNTPIQGTSADMLKLAMLALSTPPSKGARMLLTVHDELVFEVPASEVQVATRVIKERMENVQDLSVPLVVDVGVGDNWAEAH